MSAPTRFALMCSVSEPSVPGDRPHLDVNVQVWEGDQHIVTIDIARNYFTWPESASLDTAENFAAVAARVLARHVAEVQMRAVEDGVLNYREALTMENKHA